MSLKWPAKDPDASLNYSVDWSRFLGDDTIVSVKWFIYDSDGTKTEVAAPQTVNGLTFTSQSATTTVATAVFSAGTVNTTYDISCQITFGTASLVSERKIKLPIREK